MKINKLDHVNLRTTQLYTMIAWYKKVLGLTTGDRPDFPFEGAWLYAGDRVILHLVGIEGSAGIGSESGLKMEHFALTASGSDEFETSLREMGERYKRVDLSAINLIQFNLWDPDSNHMHIDFAKNE